MSEFSRLPTHRRVALGLRSLDAARRRLEVEIGFGLEETGSSALPADRFPAFEIDTDRFAVREDDLRDFQGVRAAS